MIDWEKERWRRVSRRLNSSKGIAGNIGREFPSEMRASNDRTTKRISTLLDERGGGGRAGGGEGGEGGGGGEEWKSEGEEENDSMILTRRGEEIGNIQFSITV